MSRPERLSGVRLVITSALLVVAVLAGVLSLERLLVPGAWMGVSAVLLVLLGTFTTALRRVVRSALAPTGWGAAAALVALAAVYTGPSTGPALPRPTPETIERLWRLVRTGVQSIADGQIPVGPTRGLELLVVTGALAGFLVAEMLAVGLGRAGLAGVAVAALWSPTISFERSPDLWVLLLGGTTFLLLLAATRRRPAARDVPMIAAVAGGITVLALVAGPVASVLPFYDSVLLPAGWGPAGLDAGLRLSTDLDMRASLSQRSNRPLLTYQTDVGSLGPLRMYTLSHFDGREWQRGEPSTGLSGTTGILWPADGVTVAEVGEVRVDVVGLEQDRLPIPLDPRQVEVDGTWLYDPSRDEVLGSNTTTRGLSYVVAVAPRDLSAEQLRGDDAGTSPDESYLEVPESEHVADIRALAQEVAGGEGTTYDQALALQSWFRNVQNFAYNTRVPPARTEDAVWDFLTQRSGYCVQFATAMTVMARVLGIPARMGVGFLPGEVSEDDMETYVVSGRQAHTWPELYFEDAGWVRFEPTPAGQTGSPPAYADPFAGVPVPVPTSAATETAQPTTDPGQSRPGGNANGRSGYVSIGQAEIPVLVVVGVSALVVLALVLLVLWRRRRRRPEVVVRIGADEWWTELRDRLAGYGVTWTDATTPRRAARVVRESYPRTTDATAAGGALDSLVAAVESERYSPQPGSWSIEELQAWVDAAEQPLVPAPAETTVTVAVD